MDAKKYDWLIVGAGLFGAVFASEAMKKGKSVLVVERRNKIGGNIRCEVFNGVLMHCYGAHIFHTSKSNIWDYVASRIPMTPIVHSPVAITEGHKHALSLPFNMYTFSALWPGVTTPQEAREKIIEQTIPWVDLYPNPTNLEEKALTLVGTDIYEALIKGYTEKQWGRPCTELPADVMKRIPLRYTWDNSYYYDTYVGVPEGGYNPLIEGLFSGADILTGVDFFDGRRDLEGRAENILFTGCIDEFFGFALGQLDYRSLRFDTKIKSLDETQGCSVVNYTGKDVPWTRIIEHNQFAPRKWYEEIVQSVEYPVEFGSDGGGEPYYPVVDEKNRALYGQYQALAATMPRVHFGGRLGLFEYLDMDDVINRALDMATRLI